MDKSSKLKRLQIVLVVGCLAICACDSSSTSDETITLELTVNSYEPGEDPVPIPDAEVCIVGTQDCATTGSEGTVAMQIPANAESALTVTADGFNPTLSPQIAEEADLTMRATTMLSETIAATLAAVLSTPYPLEGTGVIALTALSDPPQATDAGIAGVTLTLIDGQGQRYYLNEDGIPVASLSATTAPTGSGGFIEVPPGTYEIELGGTANNCALLSAWQGSASNRVKVPVQAGFFTDAFIICDPQ